MDETLIFQHALLPDGWARDVRLTLSGGLISKIETGIANGRDIALPGMPNLHSHAFQRAMAGHAEKRGAAQDSFWTWRELMYKLALSMQPEDVETAATLTFIEMLEGGFTSVAEFHYLHHAPDGTSYADIGEMAARLVSAAQTAGIELLLLPVFYAHAGFGGTRLHNEQRRFGNTLESYAKLYERCAQLAPSGIAPHSLRAATIEELSHLSALAGTRPFHIHIAEQAAEVEACLAFSGERPVEYLLRRAPVGRNWCLVHATHVTPQELAGITASGAVAGLCPITEANLGDGIFPAYDFTGTFGIGSDSNVLIDAAQELRMLEYSQRLATRQRNVMATIAIQATATALYMRAVAGGAQALGIGGGLTPGAPASFVTMAGDDPDIALAQSVFSSRASMVRDVWVRGHRVVRDGRHELARTARARFDAMLSKLV
ncbi:MAG TPA: formimidoylglutamate deiminase [Acidocella sp.]|nr:formimidoylglutamate deiminase [Acidocella sp.]